MRMKIVTSIMVALTVFLVTATPALSAEGKSPLFVNLTTDDTWTTGMAINFAGMALERGHKVTVFLNVSAVNLADTRITHGTHGPKNKTVPQMIADIKKKGATIIICGGCMKKAGISKDELLEGVVISNADIVMTAVFDNRTKVMSW